jgi:hypothetical protein
VSREPAKLPPLGHGAAGRALERLPGGERLPPLARVAIAFAVVALLFLAAVLTDPWGFIAFGFAAGLLVAAGVPAAQAGLMPLAALGRAALPLALPLFVFVAAGVVKSPAELQFVVGLVTLLAAWFWLIKPDWDRLPEVLRRPAKRRTGRHLLTRVGLPLAIAFGAFGFLGASIFDVLGDSDNAARTLFVLAAGCVAAAGVLRLVGYARTAFRGLLALAILLLLARLGIAVGLLPDGSPLDDVAPSTLALIAGGLLVLTSAVEIVTSLLARNAEQQPLVPYEELPAGLRTAVFLETPVTARWVTDRADFAGLGFAFLSALLLLCAVFAASSAGGAEEDVAETRRAGQPATPPGATDDRALAELFSPVLAFTADQRWTPIAVDDYVRGAKVRDWEGRTGEVATIDDLETDCPGVVRSPCYVLTQRCDDGVSDAQCAEDLPDAKAVYVRVARKEDWAGCERARRCADGSPDPFAAAQGAYRDDTEILLQYWYFYPFNEWVAPVAIGDLKQIHPADWEAVTIGLSATAPLWVAYSAHCGGTFADWGQVRVAESDPRRLRPLVAVAHGSQANYRVADESRVPNFAECSGIPKDRLSLASYAANIRDRTDDSVIWEPLPGDLRHVTAETPPMSFPGRWAPYNRMTLENLQKSLRLGKETSGPEAPPLQALWQKPMRTIFGGGAWKEG